MLTEGREAAEDPLNAANRQILRGDNGSEERGGGLPQPIQYGLMHCLEPWKKPCLATQAKGHSLVDIEDGARGLLNACRRVSFIFTEDI